MVKGRQGERVRLYVRGTILGYKRSKSNQYPNTSLIQIEGVNTKEEVGWYAGKRMAYIYKAKVKKNGSHYRCIWGKVSRPHGNSGVVRAKFKSNLPPKSMRVKVAYKKDLVAIGVTELSSFFCDSEDTGLPCDFDRSTCNGKNELCFGRGPGYPDEFESTRIIGERQFKKAVELFDKASEQLKGKVDYRHAYLNFSSLEVSLPKVGGGQEVVKTCPAAMGFSFAAGTTDGPGAFDFNQGDDKGNAFWRAVRNLIKTPSQEQWIYAHV
ncbi:hypothetical protein SO802_030966 [Lithocarpus litseifolius]|uniref:Neutral/alkaline non-lysosomal ceramidase N-terminal domain-containing protein n=1 Tax=Lithocarpus litseifolius TaxID=425828 RepID=A0AAW2BJ52_9ROSI